MLYSVSANQFMRTQRKQIFSIYYEVIIFKLTILFDFSLFSGNCHAHNAPLRRVKELGKRGSWGRGHGGSPMLTDKQCCFGEPENWTQMKPGGWVWRGRPKLDTSVIKSALKEEKREKRESSVWWEVLSCVGKMTLAEPRGFCCLNYQFSSIPLSRFLSPSVSSAWWWNIQTRPVPRV